MNTTDPTPDDSPWSSLAEELGLDTTPSRTPTNRSDSPNEDDDGFGSGLEVDLYDAAEPDSDDDTMIIPHLQSEPHAEAETDDDGQESEDGEEVGDGSEEANPGDGTKRKKRRRRRKRRGASTATDDAAPGTIDETESTETAEDDEAPVAEALDDDELPADAVMREIVKTWNVPSWDEIVAGLYRPGQHS